MLGEEGSDEKKNKLKLTKKKIKTKKMKVKGKKCSQPLKLYGTGHLA